MLDQAPSVISFLVVELKQKFCPAAPQVLFELGHHFENSSNMFYSVQKEQPCLPLFGKMYMKPGLN